MGHRAVIVIDGGGPLPLLARALLPADAPVVAIDDGVESARALGLRVDVAVGDFDSVRAEALAAAEAAGARIDRHPVDKDATDLALGLLVATELIGDERGEVVVVGTGSGRFDHLLAGVLALAHPVHARHRVRAHFGSATVHVVHGPGELHLTAHPGELLTLVPVAGDADGVRTSGLRFPLHGEQLSAGTTRGVSNVVVGDGEVVVGLDAGTVLVVLPGVTDTGRTP